MALTPDPIKDTKYNDIGAPAGAVYMVKSYGRKSVHAGSFFTLSTGVFGQADHRDLLLGIWLLALRRTIESVRADEKRV